ncbi:MAG: hypothetical protein ACI4D4_11550 [Lachnospira sp.]
MYSYVVICTVLFQLHIIPAWLDFIAIAFLYIIMLVIAISNDRKWKRNNINYLEEYESNHIEELVSRLEKFEMYDEKSINWLINQSQLFYRKDDNKFTGVGGIITSLLFPMFTVFITIITEKADLVTVIYLFTLIFAGIAVFIGMYYIMYPAIHKLVNRRKINAMEFEKDLSYVLIKM